MAQSNPHPQDFFKETKDKTDIDELLLHNKDWAKKIQQEDPDFFHRLAKC